jgi:hypothetical protein
MEKWEDEKEAMLLLFSLPFFQQFEVSLSVLNSMERLQEKKKLFNLI